MAEGIAGFLKPEELHRLARLALLSRDVVEGNLAGVHRSAHKGTSTEFADHRAYIHGDDPKHIDWKVFGRTDRYYVRRYQDETNLRVYLVLDRSASMDYGSGDVTKFRFASRLAAALGYVVVKARDSVGLFLHSDRIDASMEARNSFLHLNNLLKLVGQTRPGSATQVGPSLHQVADAIRRRALVVVLSDLFSEPADVHLALAHFRRQHHDVIVFHVLDPAEVDFPFRRPVQFEDLETHETLNVDPHALAEAYRQTFGEFIELHRKACAELKIDYRLVRTDQSVEQFVRAYLEERRRLSR